MNVPSSWILSLTGGVLIGISVTLFLLFNGRVVGISGILGGALLRTKGDFLWRLSFILGLIAGGFVLVAKNPNLIQDQVPTSQELVFLAGLLVGFGTLLGSGCTSGHGVCGVSRLSPRSVVATITFLIAGFLTVGALRALGVLA